MLLLRLKHNYMLLMLLCKANHFVQNPKNPKYDEYLFIGIFLMFPKNVAIIKKIMKVYSRVHLLSPKEPHGTPNNPKDTLIIQIYKNL